MRGVLANRLRTAGPPSFAAQGQSVSRKTGADVPLTGLSFRRSPRSGRREAVESGLHLERRRHVQTVLDEQIAVRLAVMSEHRTGDADHAKSFVPVEVLPDQGDHLQRDGILSPAPDARTADEHNPAQGGPSIPVLDGLDLLLPLLEGIAGVDREGQSDAKGSNSQRLDQRTPFQAFRRRDRHAAKPPAAPPASSSVEPGSGTAVGISTTPLNAVLPEAMASDVKAESVPLSTLAAAAVSVYVHSVLPLPVM